MLETPITEAKNTFTALVHQVEGGEVVHLTRHGRPVAVILSEVEYQELRQHSAPRGDLLDFVQDWRGDLPDDWRGLSDSEIDTARDRAPGTDFAWEA
ncbi:MAG: type II toxin-antitoxin system Phd/YefM family antitoxin [Gallionellaceae bacterium]|nr:type II toxin-antitoxin system Phd/YefM family antitoxin [Gallionellaceae bacterium]